MHGLVATAALRGLAPACRSELGPTALRCIELWAPRGLGLGFLHRVDGRGSGLASVADALRDPKLFYHAAAALAECADRVSSDWSAPELSTLDAVLGAIGSILPQYRAAESADDTAFCLRAAWVASSVGTAHADRLLPGSVGAPSPEAGALLALALEITGGVSISASETV